MNKQECGNCKWFEHAWWDTENTRDDWLNPVLGFCEWPKDRLPYSLRYGNRERMMVEPTDGDTCSCFEHPDELGLLRR